jgi:hypothetical protein
MDFNSSGTKGEAPVAIIAFRYRINRLLLSSPTTVITFPPENFAEPKLKKFSFQFQFWRENFFF